MFGGIALSRTSRLIKMENALFVDPFFGETRGIPYSFVCGTGENHQQKWATNNEQLKTMENESHDIPGFLKYTKIC